MEIAFTTLNETVVAHDTILVINLEIVPRKGDMVEIDDIIYRVENTEWHFSTRIHETDEGGYPVGEHDDTVVRLTKIGEA